MKKTTTKSNNKLITNKNTVVLFFDIQN